MMGSQLLQGLPIGLAVLIGMIFAVFPALRNRKIHKKIDIKLCGSLFFFGMYLCMVYKILFHPYIIHGGDLNYPELIYYNFDIFNTISEYIENANYVPLFGGILITIPMFPIFYMVFHKKVTKQKCALLCIMIVTAIEPLQLIINLITQYPNKVIDIDDFLLNLIGLVIGFILTDLWNKIVKKSIHMRATYFDGVTKNRNHTLENEDVAI